MEINGLAHRQAHERSKHGFISVEIDTSATVAIFHESYGRLEALDNQAFTLFSSRQEPGILYRPSSTSTTSRTTPIAIGTRSFGRVEKSTMTDTIRAGVIKHRFRNRSRKLLAEKFHHVLLRNDGRIGLVRFYALAVGTLREKNLCITQKACDIVVTAPLRAFEYSGAAGATDLLQPTTYDPDHDQVYCYYVSIPSFYGYRLFPPEDFYEYLLQNEPDRDETTPIATRCAKWFHSMTPSDADLRIDELLELRKSLTTPSPADLRHVNFLKQTAPASKGKAKALIRSMEHFDELEEAYDNHIRKDVLESPAETDATWPVSQEMQYGYIGQAFVAIFDTASFAEKTAALAKQARIDETNAATQETPAECQTGASKKRKLDHGGPAATKRLEKLNTTEATLADPKSTPQKQLRAIIHYDLTDFEAELRQAQKQQEGFTMKAPWGGKTARVWENYDSFAERWNQICLMLKTNKQLLNSLVQAD
ncbi:hypothetical protein CGCF413_v004213 [Colletotrichum fructicola]|nr:hypothetical protein CGCF413_v004213 [Colletotrichum fructicola]